MPARTKVFATAAPVLLALLLSCRKPDYFPLADNQEWEFAASEYAVTQSDTTQTAVRTYTIAVTGSAVEPGMGRVYEVRINRDGEPYLSFLFRKTRDAIFLLPESHLDGLEPTYGWMKLLELPLRVGTLWYGDEERLASFEVMAREDAVTQEGSFRDCFRIRVHAPEPYLIDVWLAPDEGVVRWHRRFSATRFELAERVRR